MIGWYSIKINQFKYECIQKFKLLSKHYTHEANVSLFPGFILQRNCQWSDKHKCNTIQYSQSFSSSQLTLPFLKKKKYENKEREDKQDHHNKNILLMIKC